VTDWLFANRTWLFSGAGLAVVGVVWGIVKYGYHRWREPRQARQSTDMQQVNYAEVPRAPRRSLLPAFIRRAIAKPGDVSSRIHIGLREEGGLSVSLGSEIPCIDLYFQVTNLSRLDLILDRLLVDVWFGQPTFQAALLDRYVIPAGEITTGMHLRQMLADNQRKQVEARTADRSRIILSVVAYFESEVGRVVVRKTIERQP
jgi:hypothetical protein